MEKYFWILIIVVNTFNAIIKRKAAQELIDRNPELEKGYNDLLKGMLLFINLPFLIMGAGILSGSVNSMKAYSNLADLNPFVLAFHLTLFMIYVLAIRWIYFKNGARFLVNHPISTGRSVYSSSSVNITEAKVKFYSGLMLLAGISSQIVMCVIKSI